jgi:broad specificity phosphatase PhoE
MPIAAVYASPLSRTMRTAAILAAPHGLEPRPVPDLREIHHGRWEQRTRREVERDFPDEHRAWEADPFTFAPEGGESGLAVLARALPALRLIVLAHEGRTVLVVWHKATIRIAVGSLLGLDLRGYRAFPTIPGMSSRARLRFSLATWREAVISTNGVDRTNARSLAPPRGASPPSWSGSP